MRIGGTGPERVRVGLYGARGTVTYSSLLSGTGTRRGVEEEARAVIILAQCWRLRTVGERVTNVRVGSSTVRDCNGLGWGQDEKNQIGSGWARRAAGSSAYVTM